MSRNALQAYGTQQVMTSSPAKLIALLYDKAIVSLKEAIHAIEEGQIEKRWQANRKAVDIITHLASTLDHENGGEIAANLDRLYEFMLARLLNVDLKNDAQAATEVVKLLQPLRDAWRQLGETAAAPVEPAAGAADTASPRPTNGAGQEGERGQGQPIDLSA